MLHRLAVLAIAGCSATDGRQRNDTEDAGLDAEDAIDQSEQVRSEQCEGIVGIEAIAWDLYAGVLVTHPVLPPPAPLGGVFSHPDLPLLGFTFPSGWTPTALRGQSLVGVNLLRDDGQALWRYISAPANGPLTAAEVIDTEVLASREGFGLQGQGMVVCSFRNQGEVSPGTGIFADVNHVLVRVDGHTVLVAASVITTSPSFPPSVFVRKIGAPTDEWPARLYDTFLAIDWQLLYGGGRNENDRDGDGFWDVFDDFPDDPQRQ